MEKVKIKIIITGATGMVGEGVLHEALNSPFIEEVLVIGRKPTGYIHPKLKEFQLLDFLIQQLKYQLDHFFRPKNLKHQ